MKKITILLAFMLITTAVFAQVGIGTKTPDPSAILEVTAGDATVKKGFLPPRLTNAQRNAISSPPAGLVIYNTNSNRLQLSNGTNWINVQDGSVITAIKTNANNGRGVVGIGTKTPNRASVLHLQSTVKGFLLPRVTTAQRNAITSPAAGLTIYNTAQGRIETYNGTRWANYDVPSIATINCAGAVNNGSLTGLVPASGVTTAVPYTGGNEASYNAQSARSTGVTGLTATLPAGNLASGNGNLTLTITGTPSTGGTASFTINFAGQNCILQLPVACQPPVTGIAINTSASGFAFPVGSNVLRIRAFWRPVIDATSYTVEYSTSATGPWTAFPGNPHKMGFAFVDGLNSPAYFVRYTVNGGCSNGFTEITPAGCAVKISPTEWKHFICKNLGAELMEFNDFLRESHAMLLATVFGYNGRYIQWGTLGNVAGTSAPAPTGSTPATANDGAVSGWNTTNAPNESWRTAGGDKTANDPCPAGWRIPTRTEWNAIAANNQRTVVGTFVNSATNYGTATQYTSFGNTVAKLLTLPANGNRSSTNGSLLERGSNGYYWSSTEGTTASNAYVFSFNNAGANANTLLARTAGAGIKCIKD